MGGLRTLFDTIYFPLRSKWSKKNTELALKNTKGAYLLASKQVGSCKMVMEQSFASSVHDKSSNWIIFEMKQKVCTSLFVFPIFCGFPVHIAERRKKIELEHFASSFAT